MSRPSVYLDTNILSALHDDSGNETLLARRIATVEWWRVERRYFALCASKHTEIELGQGSYRGQSKAIAEVRRLPYLPHSPAVDVWVATLLDSKIVPLSEAGDALHLAFAIVHRVDYLLTWNHAHLANLTVMKKLNAIVKRSGRIVPLIFSPQSIPWRSRGE